MSRWFANLKRKPADRRVEALSAYIDGALPARQQARLERELARDATLRTELDELRRTVQMLRSLPSLPAPRSFVLDPAVYGRARPRRVHLYPLLRGATVLAVLISALLFVGDLFLGSRLGGRAPAGIIAMEPAAPERAMEMPPEEEFAAEVVVEKEVQVEVVVTRVVELEMAEPAAMVAETEAEEAPAETVVEGVWEVEAAPTEVVAGEGVAEPEADSGVEKTAAESVAEPAELPAAAPAAEQPPPPTLSPEFAAAAPTAAPTASPAAQRAFSVTSAVEPTLLPAAQLVPSPTAPPAALPAAPGDAVAEEEAPQVAEAPAGSDAVTEEEALQVAEAPADRDEAAEAREGVAPVPRLPRQPQPMPWRSIAGWGAAVLVVGLLVSTLLARRFGW